MTTVSTLYFTFLASLSFFLLAVWQENACPFKLEEGGGMEKNAKKRP
jgi:hypothetical protein